MRTRYTSPIEVTAERARRNLRDLDRLPKLLPTFALLDEHCRLRPKTAATSIRETRDRLGLQLVEHVPELVDEYAPTYRERAQLERARTERARDRDRQRDQRRAARADPLLPRTVEPPPKSRPRGRGRLSTVEPVPSPLPNPTTRRASAQEAELVESLPHVRAWMLANRLRLPVSEVERIRNEARSASDA